MLYNNSILILMKNKTSRNDWKKFAYKISLSTTGSSNTKKKHADEIDLEKRLAIPDNISTKNIIHFLSNDLFKFIKKFKPYFFESTYNY